MRRISIIIIALLLFVPAISLGEVIDVMIKGVDDGVKSNRQQDYKEAVMNAKLQAIESAGVEIASITRVVNFQMKYKAVESKAEAILLPGFQVMDIGYQVDGTYQIVLSGKVEVGEDKPKEEVKGSVHIIFEGITFSETYLSWYEHSSTMRWLWYSQCASSTQSPFKFYLQMEGTQKGELIEHITYRGLTTRYNPEYTEEHYSANVMLGGPGPETCKADLLAETIRREISIPVIANKKYILWVYTEDDYEDSGVDIVSRPIIFEVTPSFPEKKVLIPLAHLLSSINETGERWRGDNTVIRSENIDQSIYSAKRLRDLFSFDIEYKSDITYFRIEAGERFDPSTMYNTLELGL